METLLTQRRHARRYREIVRVLASHGLSGLTSLFDIRARIRRVVIGGLAAEPGPPVLRTRNVRATHVRLAMEELGPTFIKLGQLLSTRSDLLPASYIEELKDLQDRVPPAPWEDIRNLLQAELGQPIGNVYRSFEEEPLAAASIGQVHAAELLDGRRVVVKIQRPKVRTIVEQDLAILADAARIASNRVALVQRADAEGFVAEFGWTLRSELDFEREGRNADALRDALAKFRGIHIPEVIWKHTSSRVLTMERVEGIRLSDRELLRKRGIDPSTLADRLIRLLAHQVLAHGMYHADPHPGNFVVGDNGALTLIDFGQVGVIDERLRERLLLLAMACAERDPSHIVDELSMIGAVPPGWDRRAMERDIAHLLTRYLGAPLRELPVSEVLGDVVRMFGRHGLRMPSELALLIKTVSMTEALVRELDPDINVISVIEPEIRQVMRRFLSPGYWADRLRNRPLEIAMLGVSMPGHVQRILSRIDRNDLTFHVRYDELPETVRAMNSMVNRLALAILTAAAGVSWSVLVLAADPDWISWGGLVFILGFVVLVLMALNVIARIWRNGR